MMMGCKRRDVQTEWYIPYMESVLGKKELASRICKDSGERMQVRFGVQGKGKHTHTHVTPFGIVILPVGILRKIRMTHKIKHKESQALRIHRNII